MSTVQNLINHVKEYEDTPTSTVRDDTQARIKLDRVAREVLGDAHAFNVDNIKKANQAGLKLRPVRGVGVGIETKKGLVFP
jgi:hypothetical protein